MYRKILPKGCNIEATNDTQKLKTFLENMKFSNETISAIIEGAQAFIVRNFEGKTLFFLPIEKFSGEKAVNVAVHEPKHACSQNLTLASKVDERFLKKVGEQKYKEEMFGDIDKVNTKNLDIQTILRGMILKIWGDPLDGIVRTNADLKGVLQLSGLSLRRLDAKLRKCIRSILEPSSEKENIKLLNVLREILADEAEAYRVGGEAAKKYLELNKGSTTSEMVSQLYKETDHIIRQERKLQIKKLSKRTSGLKVRNYEGKPIRISYKNLSEDMKNNVLEIKKAFEKEHAYEGQEVPISITLPSQKTITVAKIPEV